MPAALSSYVLTCNSARTLARVLAPLRQVADEVIVADSGSTDQTVAIARAAGCRVESRPFTNFHEQRNWAQSLCAHDHVLFLDSDEIMTDGLVEALLDLKERGFGHDGYLIRRETHVCGRKVHAFYPAVSPDYQTRLFRRSKASFAPTHRVHERVVGTQDLAHIEATVEHHSVADLAELERKLQLYTDLAAADLAERGSPSWVLALRAYTRAPFAFVKWYGPKRGFKDGWLGVTLAVFAYRYTLLKYLKASRLAAASHAARSLPRTDGVPASRDG
jgi:glycosyltransferase involved in cell wall biosynthesis